MKKICKVICRILWIFMCFVLVNLVIWTIIYWWTKNYSEILNQKDWQQSLSEISLLKPKTRVAMFYKDSRENLEKTVEESLLNEADNRNISDVDRILEEFLSGDYENTEEIEDTVNHNPYDPDYEDEFNSFFWVTSEDNSPTIIPVQEIEDLETAGFVVDEITEN